MNKFLLLFIVFLSLSVSVSAELNNGAWAKFGYDINNTGLSPFESNSTGAERWNFTTGDCYYYCGVAIDNNDILYVSNGNSGKLHAIYTNGTEKWNYTVSASGIVTTPLIDNNGIIYVGDWSDTLYAVYPNGTLKWSIDITGSTEGGSATIDNNGVIYQGVSSGTKSLYAIYNNGTEKWNFSTSFGIGSTPLIDTDGIIYFGSFDSKLYAVYPNGTEKWNFTVNGDIYDSPILYNNNIYFGSTGNDYYALYKNGSKIWNYTSSSSIYVSSIGNTGIIYLGSASKLLALYNNGSLKWTYNTSGFIRSKPTIDLNELIYFGDYADNLYALYPNGSLKWTSYIANADFEAPISIGSNGVLYFTTWKDKLYAFGFGNPVFSSPYNSETANNISDISVTMDNDVTFTITSSHAIETYSWFKNGIAVSDNNQNSYITNFGIGSNNISVYGSNIDGISNTVLWNITGDYTEQDRQMNPIWRMIVSLINNIGGILKLIVYGVVIILMFAFVGFVGKLFSGLKK